MAMTGGDAPGDERFIAFQINEARSVMAGACENIAIAALQRRARNHAMAALIAQVLDPGGDCLEPGLAIGIGERRAALHFLDIGSGVKPIAVLKTPAEFLRKKRGDCCLA